MKRPQPVTIAGFATAAGVAILSYGLSFGEANAIVFSVICALGGYGLGVTFYLAARGRLLRRGSAPVQVPRDFPALIACRIIGRARLVCAALCTLVALATLAGGATQWGFTTWFAFVTAMLIVETVRSDAEGFVALPWIGGVVAFVCAGFAVLMTQGGRREHSYFPGDDINVREKNALFGARANHFFHWDTETLLGYGALILLALSVVQTLAGLASIFIQARRQRRE